MIVVLTFAAVVAVVAAHALACHRTALPSIVSFAIVSLAGAAALLAGLSVLSVSKPFVISAMLIFGGACELYLFLFTLSAASISSNILARLAACPTAPAALQASYSGVDMARLRVARALEAGLIEERGDTLSLTSRGRLFAAPITALRTFFRHDTPCVAPVRWRLAALPPALLLFAAPIAAVAWHGWTLTGLFEESLGYRYFYSLRAVYDPPTPGLPQGQAVDLYHQFLQAVLTFAGYPFDSIVPRVDVWSYLSVGGMELVNALALVALVARMRNGLAVALTTALWGAFLYANQFSFVYGLLQPDYPAIEPALAMASAALLIDVLRGEPPARGKLGLLLGVAVATKITLAALPLFPAGIAIVAGKRSLRSRALLATTIAAIALLTCGGIVAAWSGFRPGQIKAAIDATIDMTRTGAGVAEAPPFMPWIVGHLRGDHGPIQAALCFAPLIAAAFAFSRVHRRTAIVCALGLAFEVAFLYRRDYAITLMETALACLLVLSALIAICETRVRLAVAAAVVVVLLMPLRFGTIGSIVDAADVNTAEQARMPPLDQPAQIWLVPSNDLRPLSIQSAVMKGTVDGHSALMKRMFPNIAFRFMQPGGTVPIDAYRNAYFLPKTDETPQQAAERVAEFYGFRWNGWSCNSGPTISGVTVVHCSR